MAGLCIADTLVCNFGHFLSLSKTLFVTEQHWGKLQQVSSWTFQIKWPTILWLCC